MAERVTGTVVNWDSFLGIGFIERDFCEDDELTFKYAKERCYW